MPALAKISARLGFLFSHITRCPWQSHREEESLCGSPFQITVYHNREGDASEPPQMHTVASAFLSFLPWAKEMLSCSSMAVCSPTSLALWRRHYRVLALTQPSKCTHLASKRSGSNMVVLDSDTEALKTVEKGHPRLSQQPRDYISRKTQSGTAYEVHPRIPLWEFGNAKT